MVLRRNSISHPTQHKSFHAAWLIIAIVALFGIYKFFLIIFPNDIITRLSLEFHVSATDISFSLSILLFAQLLMFIPSGYLTDRYTVRKMLTFAGILLTIGALLFSLATHYSLIIVSRFITGLGGAFSLAGMVKILSYWVPQKHFAFIFGITQASIVIIGSIADMALLSCIHSWGWRNTATSIMVIGIMLTVLIWIIVRDYPHNISPIKTKDRINLHALKKITKDKQMWLLALYDGMAYGQIIAVSGLWGVSAISKTYDLPTAVASKVNGIVFIGFAIGAPLAGWLSDYIKKRRLIILVSSLLLSINYLLALVILNMPLLLNLIRLFGIGLFTSASIICYAMIKDKYNNTSVATATGFVNTISMLISAILPLLISSLISYHVSGITSSGKSVYTSFDYSFGMSVLPISATLGLVLALFIKETFNVNRGENCG